MAFVKAFHVLFVFIWVGNLLALTRLMGYHTKEEENVQFRLARLYRRMYLFVGLPTLVLALLCGAVLIYQLDPEKGLFWFMVKISAAIGLILCDMLCGQYVNELNLKSDTSKGIRYKILHGVSGLFLIAVIVSLYLLR